MSTGNNLLSEIYLVDIYFMLWVVTIIASKSVDTIFLSFWGKKDVS